MEAAKTAKAAAEEGKATAEVGPAPQWPADIAPDGFTVAVALLRSPCETRDATRARARLEEEAHGPRACS